MKLCLATVFASILFIPVFLVSAQTCGNITTPANLYYEGSGEYSDPIANCANPFGRTGDLTTFTLNNQTVTNNTSYTVSASGTSQYGFAGETYNKRTGADYYLHSANNYIRVNTNFAEPTQADLEAEIPNFFNGNQQKIDYYSRIYQSGDKLSFFLVTTSPRVFRTDPFDASRRVIDVYNELEQYMRLNAKSARPALLPGTYTVTLVDTDEGPAQSFAPSLIQRVLATIIPTAHAYYYVNTVTFTLVGPAPEPVGASSVLFLPGIQASRLYKDGLLGTEDQIWVPDGNQDVRQLAMSSLGVSQNQVYTRGILENLPIGGTVYDSFARSMVNLVQDKVIESWTPFAYDWRYSVKDIAENGTQYQNDIRNVIDEIEYLSAHSYTDKVTIIGHSNGGLLAKAIVKKLEQEGKTNLVDRVILLASPQLGTPKAIGTILHGYDQEKFGGWAIDDVVARDVIQNMPGAYGLVTSQKYFDSASDKVIRFENTTTTQVFRSAYGDTIDSEDELRRFMTGESDNRSQATTIDEVLRSNNGLLTNQLNYHRNTLDNWTAPSGVKVTEIVGTGLDTVSGFEYRSFRERNTSSIVVA